MDSTPQRSAEVVAACCEKSLALDGKLGCEYFYQSLPLCVIDAVFSIGVRYKSVQRVVRRYCDYFNLQQFRKEGTALPPEENQLSVADFVDQMLRYGSEIFTQKIFNNRQRTSTRNGIRKSDAVQRFAEALQKHHVNYLQDVAKILSNPAFTSAITLIPGQRSGISLSYFFMLSGSDDLVKEDRWIFRFLERCLNRKVAQGEALQILVGACQKLKPNHPNLTPRLLDNLVWNYERSWKLLTEGRNGKICTRR